MAAFLYVRLVVEGRTMEYGQQHARGYPQRPISKISTIWADFILCQIGVAVEREGELNAPEQSPSQHIRLVSGMPSGDHLSYLRDLFMTLREYVIIFVWFATRILAMPFFKVSVTVSASPSSFPTMP